MTAAVREPYVGPRPFDAADRDRFFGRTAESLAVVERWSTRRLTVLYGPPGAGKTSLLQAGAIPLASTFGGHGRVVLPVGTLAAPGAAAPAVEGNPLSLALLSSWSPSPGDGPPRSIEAFLQGLQPRHPPDLSPILAVIDQFECIFQDKRHGSYLPDFVSQLLEALRRVPHLHLLISVREDFLTHLGELEDAIDQRGRYRLGPLLPEAALDAVAGPLRGTGRSFAPGAAEEIVRNLCTNRAVAEPSEREETEVEIVEPAQLQAVCSALWKALPEAEVITTEDLYGPADLDSGLVQFCEHAVRDVARAQRLPGRDLAAWLVRTFITDRGTRGTAYEGKAGVGGMPAVVAEQFVDRYILSAECRLGARWYRFPNDRLVASVRECLDRWTGEPTSSADPAASLTAAEDALAAGDLALAARRATEAVRTSGSRDTHTKATALSCLGQVAAQGGHDQEAESHFRAAIQLFDVIQDRAGCGRLLGELGRVLLRNGRYAEAIAELQNAETRAPSDLTIQLDLARALRECGQLWAATAVLNTTLTIAPGTVEALVERGLIRIRTGELSYALDDLNNAIRLRPAIGQQADIRSARAHAQAQLHRTA